MQHQSVAEQAKVKGATGEFSGLLHHIGIAAKKVDREVNKACLVDILREAGGMATEGDRRILDIEPMDIHQRTPLYIGSSNLVMKLLDFIREEKRKSGAGYISQVSIYRAAKCMGCPVRGLCNKAKGNRQIEVNHTLNRYKEKIRYLLSSEEGLFHRKKRPVEPEAVFADIKEAGKFRRLRVREATGAGIEFGLKAIAHNINKMAVRIAERNFFDGKSQKTTHYGLKKLKTNYCRKGMAA